MQKVDVVYAAASTKNDYSLALSIVSEYLNEGVRVENLGFPMSRDEEVLNDAWEKNAEAVAETLDQGLSAAFVTLGDPLVYSTFGYLLKTIRKIRPDLPVVIVPGITSYQAAAARTETILTESRQNLLITTGVGQDPKLKGLLEASDNTVILKTYKSFPFICDTLEELGMDRNAVLVSCLDQEGERVVRNIKELRGEKLPYLSLLIVKKKPERSA